MKLFLPFLLVCLALGNSNLELLEEKKRTAKAVLILDYLMKVHERTERLRKLQKTDSTDGETSNPLDKGTENITTTEATAETPKTTTNSDASYQIKKILF